MLLPFEKSKQVYTLYLDESGDWGYPNFNPLNPVLCLCGCIFQNDYYLTVERTIRVFKKKWLKRDVVLHRTSIQRLNGEFSILKNAERLGNFVSRTSHLFAGMELRLLIAALDKPDLHATYGTQKIDQWLPSDVYFLLFTFIVERFVAFLRDAGRYKGKIIAESRGTKEDNRVQFQYAKLLEGGTQFYHGWQFRELLPTAIEFHCKRDNIAGLQVADWIAMPMSKKVQAPDGKFDEHNEWELYKNKIWLGSNAPGPGQVGFKTFPKPLGRKLLNMPLKSA